MPIHPGDKVIPDFADEETVQEMMRRGLLLAKTRFTVVGSRPHEVNTDPLRRCYNGAHFSSRIEFPYWCALGGSANEEEALESLASWRRLNPTHRYMIVRPVPERESKPGDMS